MLFNIAYTKKKYYDIDHSISSCFEILTKFLNFIFTKKSEISLL